MRGRQAWGAATAFTICSIAMMACQGQQADPEAARVLRLATSHTLEQSGVYAALAPAMSRATGLSVEPYFVGTGKALKMARAGGSDVVWVHSRPLEDAFIAEGFGINRQSVMYSQYVVVGPPSDPAGIKGLSATEGLSRIAETKSPFVSRGDESGTHQREQALWTLAGVEPHRPWYSRRNAGMRATLERASELHAYALSDLPTFLAHRKEIDSVVLVQGDSRLHNPYAVIAVNPMRVPEVDYDAAMAFIDFLISPSAQKLIASFGQAEYGRTVFSPMAGKGRD